MSVHTVRTVWAPTLLRQVLHIMHVLGSRRKGRPHVARQTQQAPHAKYIEHQGMLMS